MKHDHKFMENGGGEINRYTFDWGACHTSKGFAQIDTTQDASYYGNWINPVALMVVRWCEGDLDTFTFDNSEEMVAWIAEFKKSPRFLGIDPGLGEVLKSECIAAGLGPFLH